MCSRRGRIGRLTSVSLPGQRRQQRRQRQRQRATAREGKRARDTVLRRWSEVALLALSAVLAQLPRSLRGEPRRFVGVAQGGQGGRGSGGRPISGARPARAWGHSRNTDSADSAGDAGCSSLAVRRAGRAVPGPINLPRGWGHGSGWLVLGSMRDLRYYRLVFFRGLGRVGQGRGRRRSSSRNPGIQPSQPLTTVARLHVCEVSAVWHRGPAALSSWIMSGLID